MARRLSGPPQWIFPSTRKPGRHTTKLNGPHDRICEATGLRFVIYDFRHTFATRIARSGVDLATLAAILGHSSLRSVMKYVHPTAEHQKAAMIHYDRLMKDRSTALIQ